MGGVGEHPQAELEGQVRGGRGGSPVSAPSRSGRSVCGARPSGVRHTGNTRPSVSGARHSGNIRGSVCRYRHTGDARPSVSGARYSGNIRCSVCRYSDHFAIGTVTDIRVGAAGVWEVNAEPEVSLFQNNLASEIDSQHFSVGLQVREGDMVARVRGVVADGDDGGVERHQGEEEHGDMHSTRGRRSGSR